MNWEGFKYEPVRGLIERIQRRVYRAQRRVTLRNAVTSGLIDLVDRLRKLRDTSRGWGEYKQHQFTRILDDFTRKTTAPVSEAAPVTEAGPVGVPST